MIEEEEISMDRDTQATLYRTNVPEADSMRTDGRIEDLVRAFKVLPKATQREYSITVGEMKYGLDQINTFAREFGINTSTTLADLLTPLLDTNPFSTVRASFRWQLSNERDNGVADGRAAWLRRRSIDSFFPASLF